MPLEQAGIEYISKNFNDFIKNIGKASTAVASMGNISEATSARLNSFGDSLSSNAEAMGSLANAGRSLSNMFGDLFRNIGKGIAIGGAIGGLLGFVGTALGGPLAILGGGVGRVVGSIVGAILAGAVGISKALYNLGRSIGEAVITFLPKTVAKIARVGFDIAKALYEFSSKVISVAKAILSPIAKAVKSVFDSIFGMFGSGGASRGGWRSLGGSIFTAMFKFEALKQVVRALINEIKSLASSSFNAAVELQTLTIRLDNLIGMQVRSAGITEDYGKSIKIASGYTQELLRWVEKMALSTPVSVEDVANTVSLSIAMGWTVKSAKELTKAILDYTVGQGLSSEVTERIIYNFAQMKQQGKVTGTELRDLGRGAFMPINKVLREMYENIYDLDKGMESATMSFAQFKEEAAAGKADVEEFFIAFEDFVGTNLPDAAYRMNFTFSAVRQNISDLFKILVGWNVLGPVIKSITQPIQDFINKFKQADAIAKASAIGKTLAFMFNAIKTGFSKITGAIGDVLKAMGIVAPTIENVIISMAKFGMAIRTVLTGIAGLIRGLIPFAQQIKGTIGKTFEDMGGTVQTFSKDTRDKTNKTFSAMSSDFFTWGAKLVINFARGMVEAAAKVLTQAMNFIGRILTWWLSPGSPPRILPEIDKWGMETINEWLHGMTQADFDILNDMQGSVKSALDALVAFGVLTDEQALSNYLSMSVDLIRAMDELNRTGQVTIDVFQNLRNIGGVIGQEVTELLDLQIKHAIALEHVEAAQRAYDDAVKATQQSHVKAKGLINEYNKMLRAGADRGLLKNKLKIVNAAEMELDVNRKAELSRKTELDLAQEQLKIIEAQVKLQESLIKQLTDLAQAQRDATKGAAGAAEEITEAIDNLLEGLGDVGGGLELDFEGLLNQAATEWNKFLHQELPRIWGDAWNKNFTDPSSPFQVALNSMKTAWILVWNEMAEAVHLPTWDEITKAWNAPIPDVGLRRGKDKIQPSESKGLLQKFQDVIDLFAKDVENDGGILATLGRVAGFILGKLVDKISEAFSNKDNQEKLKAAFDTFMQWITNLILGEDTQPIGAAVGGAENVEPGPWAVRLGNRLIEELKKAANNAIEQVDWGELFISIGIWALKALIQVSGRIAAIGYEIAKYIFEGIVSLLTPSNLLNLIISALPAGKLGEWIIKNLVGQMPTEGITWAPPEFDISNWETNGTDISDGLYNSIYEGVDGKPWDDAWSPIDKSFRRIFKNDSDSRLFIDYGKDTVNGFFTGISEQIAAITWNTIWKSIIDGFKLLFGIGSESTVFKEFGVNIIDGLKSGLVNTLKGLLGPQGAITIAINNFINGIKGLFGLNASNPSANPFYTAGQAIVQGIIAGFNSMIATFVSTWNALIRLLPDSIEGALLIDSPSKVMKRIGRDVVKGLALGITDSSWIVDKALGVISGSIKEKMYARQNATMQASPVYGGATLNFGDVNINNGMDFAVFKAMVQKAIVEV